MAMIDAAGVWSVGAETHNLEAIGLLAEAFVLSSIIGLERQLRQKSAGLRTHALVGMGAALFALVSGYGFSTLLGDHVILDPSRIAAQIVSGIGFLGAGVIFTRGDVVRGLTTAAAIWVTAAVGMASGAGLPWLALAGTIFYLITTAVITPLLARLPGASAREVIMLRYEDGKGVLRDVLAESTSLGFAAEVLSTDKTDKSEVTMRARFRGRPPLPALIASLTEIDGVISVRTARQDTDQDDD
ncbi:MgtC/SapB family protein [Spelaeicoccus albus]|uniref:Putative Mg2+ transporter-C (MgtC) family protein n=2 Tax=Spelaeicoccus albus TaxID=1280376 RepID=A0A7Z0IIN4_9MICO|nr:putative Mg2+ transporter-C (MgtC) family protein [Spelaeicoccus albus]